MMKKVLFLLPFLFAFSAHANCVKFSDYAPVGDGVADDSAKLDAFLDDVKASNNKTGCVGSGLYRITYQMDDFASEVHLKGSGLGKAIFLRDYNGIAGKGFFHFTQGSNGSKLEGFSILARAGTTGGAALSIRSTPESAVSFITVEDVQFSTYGNNSYDSTVIIDGTQKVTQPAGVRDINFRNVHIFGSTGFSLSLQSVNSFSWHGGGSYPAGGTGLASGGVAIGGLSNNRSNYITISVPVCNGLNLTNSSYGLIDCTSIGAIGGISINTSSSATHYRTRGAATGSVLNNWQFSRHD